MMIVDVPYAMPPGATGVAADAQAGQLGHGAWHPDHG
jgi:hypothetical protein